MLLNCIIYTPPLSIGMIKFKVFNIHFSDFHTPVMCFVPLDTVMPLGYTAASS